MGVREQGVGIARRQYLDKAGAIGIRRDDKYKTGRIRTWGLGSGEWALHGAVPVGFRTGAGNGHCKALCLWVGGREQGGVTVMGLKVYEI